MTNTYRLGLLAALLAAGCKPKDSAPAAAPPAAPATAPGIESVTFAPALEVDLAKCTKTPTGLYYRDLVVGSGPEVVSGQQVSVHYRGTLPDGTQFDANGPNDAPYSFRVGTHEVIDGWDQGVAGMRVGGKRQLILPPALGYGARANGPIPANAILVFTVEVLSAQ